MQNRRFGKKIKLPSTIAIKHQILKLMLVDAIESEKAKAASPRFKELPPTRR